MSTLKRIACYVRVSTNHEEQVTSFSAQMESFQRLVKQHPDWVLVKIYHDKGRSGTRIAQRPGFNQMIQDAKAGQIDLILTKSISRFSRNTLDLLTTIRELKAIKVEVYFGTEHISSFDPKCEMMLSIMASLAQEESRNLSENIKWGITRRMEKGELTLSYGRFLGYKKGKDGRPEIAKREARVVRDIYNKFLNGMSLNRIALCLTKREVKPPGQGKRWYDTTIRYILTNEKYKGEALLQKTYTPDYLIHKPVPNNRIIRQYYVQDSHPAIIEPEIWEKVQEELRRRGYKTRNG